MFEPTTRGDEDVVVGGGGGDDAFVGDWFGGRETRIRVGVSPKSFELVLFFRQFEQLQIERSTDLSNVRGERVHACRERFILVRGRERGERLFSTRGGDVSFPRAFVRDVLSPLSVSRFDGEVQRRHLGVTRVELDARGVDERLRLFLRQRDVEFGQVRVGVRRRVSIGSQLLNFFLERRHVSVVRHRARF